VFLHGWTRTATDVEPLAAVALAEKPNADHFIPHLPITRVFSRVRAENLADSLVDRITSLVARREREGHGGYLAITLVGHSCGAVLARAVWALAAGGQQDGTTNPSKAKPWARLVERLVLLAAVARGWTSDAPVSPSVRLLAWVGNVLEPIIGHRFLVFDLRRGSPFLTTTRLQTIDALNRVGAEAPITVQLLGDKDDLVAPADNVDLASGYDFFYLRVPDSGHMDVVDLIDASFGNGRREAFRVAFSEASSVLGQHPYTYTAHEVADLVAEGRDNHDQHELWPPSIGEKAEEATGSSVSPPPPALRVLRDVKNVTFLVHGIRDYGFWTKKLAVRIKRHAREHGLLCRTVTSSYGFFPMGPFLLKSQRRKHVGWLMDQYVTAKALYPEADDFCFVGHSNGTYLLARSLLDCPAVRFRRVVFAGSVVRATYEWEALIERGSVAEVVNYVATNDWVVASVPRALQQFRFPDLGDAGHGGFGDVPGLTQIRFVPGEHSAALDERHWDEIATFVLDGVKPPQQFPDHVHGTRERRADGQEPLATTLARLSWCLMPLAVILMLGLLVLAGWLLYSLGPLNGSLAVGLILVVSILRRVLVNI